MKHHFTLILILGTLQIGFAQQPAQYSLHMFNNFSFNPAYAGIDNSLSVTAVFRKQWVNLPESPTTENVNAHMPLYLLHGGVGIEVENETLGNFQQTSALLAYDFQLPINRAGILSIGLSGGVVQRSLDGTKIRTPEGQYTTEPPTTFTHNDPILPNGDESGTSVAVNVGLYFQSERLEAGISAINLTEQTIDLTALEFKPERNYYFTATYTLDINRSLTLRPSILVKSNFNQTQIDFSALLNYNDNFFGGASFRGYNSDSVDAVAFIGGVKLNEKITLAYSYDLTLSNLNTVSSGSHEILINYNLGKIIGKGRPPKIIYNPRFL